MSPLSICIRVCFCLNALSVRNLGPTHWTEISFAFQLRSLVKAWVHFFCLQLWDKYLTSCSTVIFSWKKTTLKSKPWRKWPETIPVLFRSHDTLQIIKEIKKLSVGSYHLQLYAATSWWQKMLWSNKTWETWHRQSFLFIVDWLYKIKCGTK